MISAVKKNIEGVRKKAFLGEGVLGAGNLSTAAREDLSERLTWAGGEGGF